MIYVLLAQTCCWTNNVLSVIKNALMLTKKKSFWMNMQLDAMDDGNS